VVSFLLYGNGYGFGYQLRDSQKVNCHKYYLEHGLIRSQGFETRVTRYRKKSIIGKKTGKL